jgi:hypothetical protein
MGSVLYKILRRELIPEYGKLVLPDTEDIRLVCNRLNVTNPPTYYIKE